MVNFFANFFDTLFHFIIPTDDMVEDIFSHYDDIKTIIASKFGIIEDFQNELEVIRNIDPREFLKIYVPSWGLNFGSINFSTEGKYYTDVYDAYEPHREGVRSWLVYTVYAMGAVYIVKYFINYGQTQAFNRSIGSKRSDDE